MTNRERYAAWCEQIGNVPLMMQPWWLEAVCAGKEWDVILVESQKSKDESRSASGVEKASKEESQIYLCASVNAEGQYAINILNTGKATNVPVQIGEYAAQIEMPANSVKTILVKL